MNLGEARTLVRFYINEPAAAQWTDANLNSLIVSANNEIYSLIVTRATDLFLRTVRFTYAANATSLTLDTATDAITSTAIGRWLKWLTLIQVESNADFSATNAPYRLDVSHKLWDLYERPVDVRFQNASANAGLGEFRWCLQGRKLHIYPIPPADIYLIAHIIPAVFAPTSDAHQLLSLDSGSTGELTEHHELIPMLAALKARINVDDDTQSLRQLYQEKRKILDELLGAMQQLAEPKRSTARHH